MSYLPTWAECDYRRMVGNQLNELERFLYDHLPADRETERVFREQLLAVLNAAYKAGGGWFDGYREPSDPTYGNLTPQQISEYQDYEERRNRGN